MSESMGVRRLPLHRLPKTRWEQQEPSWQGARPALIEGALKRALARPSGNWFVLAASTEIRPGQPFGRMVAGVEVVAWRSRDNVVHAAPGSCPHLGAPLCRGAVRGDRLVCRWHGLSLGPEGFPGWSPFPVHDDGVLVWVRLDAVGGEEPLAAPIVPERPERRTLAAVASIAGRCEPEDVIANRLDPWHGSWFHPYSFVDLRVVEAPEEGVADADDRFVVDVAFKVAGRWGVPVRAEFRCPEPRTIVMRILEGEGAGSVVETHATPLGVDRNGVPRTAVIEATVATSPRPGFGVARRMAPVVRPLMRFAARRLWRDDLAYAERRYALRSAGRWPS